MRKKSGLSRIFKSVAAASTAALLATTLMVGAPGVSAQSTDTQQQNSAPAQIYRHPTLASKSNEPVGIQLVLAMDTSGSMSSEEFAIELEATANALNSRLFRSEIKYKAGAHSIAIAVVDFDDSAQIRVAWVDIRGEEINDKPYRPGEAESSVAPDKLDALAQEIISIPRRSAGGTATNTAMDLSNMLYLGCPWAATERRVLDVFSDGSSYGWYMEKSREQLAALGVTINGFAIVNEEPTLEQFFNEYLVTKKFQRSPDGIYSQPGRVWAVARNLQSSGNTQPGLKSFFGEVTRAMRQKISVEVAGTQDYYAALTRLGLKPGFALPAPVSEPGK